jgi:hypothetical protein
MTDVIVDTLLVTLGDVDGYRGETFDGDTAVKVFDTAAAILQGASEDERQLLVRRARRLAAEGGDPDRIAFFETIGARLGFEDTDEPESKK